MAAIKMTQNSFETILLEMKKNDGKLINNEYYFTTSEINTAELRTTAFKHNLIISIEIVDELVSKLKFVTYLT